MTCRGARDAATCTRRSLPIGSTHNERSIREDETRTFVNCSRRAPRVRLELSGQQQALRRLLALAPLLVCYKYALQLHALERVRVVAFARRVAALEGEKDERHDVPRNEDVHSVVLARADDEHRKRGGEAPRHYLEHDPLHP